MKYLAVLIICVIFSINSISQNIYMWTDTITNIKYLAVGCIIAKYPNGVKKIINWDVNLSEEYYAKLEAEIKKNRYYYKTKKFIRSYRRFTYGEKDAVQEFLKKILNEMDAK